MRKESNSSGWSKNGFHLPHLPGFTADLWYFKGKLKQFFSCMLLFDWGDYFRPPSDNVNHSPLCRSPFKYLGLLNSIMGNTVIYPQHPDIDCMYYFVHT